MQSAYVFEVQLLDVKPRIWRKFALANTVTFKGLHAAIQGACGWDGSQIYRFHATRSGPVLAGIRDRKSSGKPDLDASRKKLDSYFRSRRGKCFYEYDFGDDWWFEIILVEHVELPGKRKRALLDGALSFPPENCGGPAGYKRCVAAVTGRGWSAYAGDDERTELQAWLDGWKPDDFDLARERRAFDR